MKQITPFPNSDLYLIKWQILAFVLSLVVVGGILWSADYLNGQANRGLQIARADLSNARSSVELIEEEEATIIEYIGRYQQLSEQGTVSPEDRLQFLEQMAEIRSEFNLFPISLNINEQLSERLDYDESVNDPGGPIDLDFSSVSLSVALLHEEDLVRMLGAIYERPGLYQVRECDISLQNRLNNNFLFLAQHLRANCELVWYTFNVSP